ncbi:MAG: lipocalin family protein [Bdellovibrionales bacterium]|nr:lipocalin family protein [Bdellovibrionales bacterium]
MKKLLMILAIITMSALSAQANDTVENLDIQKYMGKWYEIASIPQSFSEDCFTNTTAEYELEEDGRVNVINSCEEEDGKVDVANGKARVK